MARAVLAIQSSLGPGEGERVSGGARGTRRSLCKRCRSLSRLRLTLLPLTPHPPTHPPTT